MTQASKKSVPSYGGRRRQAIWSGPLAILVGSLIGCGPASEPVAPPPPPPTPEERFDRIVGALEDKLNDSAFGTADAVSDYNAPAGTPITAAKVEVKHTLTPPDGEGGVHHAQLCFITKAKVTVTLPTKSDEEDDEEKPSSRRTSPEKEPLGEGLPDMDSLIVPSREEAASRLGSSGVHEIDPGVTQRCFELEFREGQWVLVSEVDKENEPFNALAIEYALKKQ
jgi:hypothetical protein